VNSAVEFRVGTASWTDPSLINSDLFYPPSVRSPEDRLRFYAERFNTVEVDSTYYALPAERNAKLWAERTPERFLFNIKPFALMTQHPAEISRLPEELRDRLPAHQRKERQLTRPPREIVDIAFRMFWSAMEPLREAGKLGMIAFQFPPYFVANPRNSDYLAGLPERLPGASIAPEDKAIVPSFVEATGDQAYVRFHGKNRENWFKRNISAAERFKYLYSESELGLLAQGLENLKERGVRRAYAIFNNCYQNFGIMNATTMATILGGRD
jgi:uncharacterized protein YecE (DUF72 family)